MCVPGYGGGNKSNRDLCIQSKQYLFDKLVNGCVFGLERADIEQDILHR